MTVRSFPRKTAPRVVGGRPMKKNRWAVTVDGELRAGRGPLAIERRPARPGFVHVLTEDDVRRFLRCIPDADEVTEGLGAIVLAPGEPNTQGCYRRDLGEVHLHAWELEGDGLWQRWSRDIFDEHRELLERLGVPCDEPAGDDALVRLYFDERAARAFMLAHVLLHELGHHLDRRSARNPDRDGEPFAEAWAYRCEARVWARYKEFFGAPCVRRG